MNIKREKFARLLVVMFLCFYSFNGFAETKRDKILSGFNKTAFGSEYASFGFQTNFIKKYSGTVKFYIHNLSKTNRKKAAKRFIRSLNRSIKGLKTRVVNDPKKANFQLYVVDRKDYAKTVRSKINRSFFTPVRGQCLVRVNYGKRGITKSSAVIVSDAGERLFKRCLIEEILQGLGPLNEDPSLMASMFNDRTKHTRFTKFDRYILNILYDKRLKPGASQRSVQKLLPRIYRDVNRRLR